MENFQVYTYVTVHWLTMVFQMWSQLDWFNQQDHKPIFFTIASILSSIWTHLQPFPEDQDAVN